MALTPPRRSPAALAAACFSAALLLLSAKAQAPKTSPELTVWSGDKPAGQTWAKLGPKGSLKATEGAGAGADRRGFVLHMDGDGYRGCPPRRRMCL